MKLSLDLDQAADVSGFTKKQLTERIRTGELKAKRAARKKDEPTEGAGKFIILVRDLEAFLEELPDA